MFCDIRVGIHASMCLPPIFDIHHRAPSQHAFQDMEHMLDSDMLAGLEMWKLIRAFVNWPSIILTRIFFLSLNAIKLPVVVGSGAGVIITGGLVLSVPAINKDMMCIRWQPIYIVKTKIMKIETKIENLSTWFTNFTRCRTQKPHFFVNFTSFFSGSFAVVTAFIVKAVILAGSTIITRKCARRLHK